MPALHKILIKPLPPGGVSEALGGAASQRQLWWTLKELTEVSSCDSPRGGRIASKMMLYGGGGGSAGEGIDE